MASKTKAPARKPRRGAKKAAPVDDNVMQDIDIVIGEDGAIQPFAAQPGLITPHADGDVTIDLDPQPEPLKDSKFDDNLAELLDESTLGGIVMPLLDAIDEDDRDRSEWITQRADGLDLLGLKVEKPGAGNVGTSSVAVPGQSTVRDGLLSEAIFRFQANAFAELCPSEGPCKVENFGAETPESDGLAESFEKDMNYFLTTTAREYYPDTRKMLWWTGYASGMFKKVYRCPLRNRPVSESVDGSDLIVPSNVTDLHNAGRITHQINMRQATMKRMQLLGVYRNVPLGIPTPDANQLQTKQADLTGMNINTQRPEDQDYTIYECYCELDIPGFEHKRNGEVTGLPLPYRVTIDKDSRTILEIRRNWNELKPSGPDDLEDEDDEDEVLPTAKIPFVMFPYATGLGFYGTGLLHQLGNYTMALTAMLRECIDAGMFASFPGFLYAKGAGRQLQNEFRVPPGGGAPIDTGMMPLRDAIMPLPYKDVSTAMVALMAQTRDNAARYGGTAEAPTGEGVMNAPVGSVLAAIDQATRIEGGVHKALYAAQKEELELLKELFRDDPEALWRGNKRPAMGPDHATRVQRLKLALEDCNLVPASDPNVPSHMHRMAKATTLLQTAMALPGAFKMPETLTQWGNMVRIDNIQSLLAPPQQNVPDPAAQAVAAKLQIDKQNADTKAQQVQLQHQAAQAKIQSQEQIEATKIAAQHVAGENLGQSQPDPLQAQALQLKQQQVHQAGVKMALDAHNSHADRQSREGIEAIKLAQAEAVHPLSAPVVDRTLDQMSAFMNPAAQQPAPKMSDGGSIGDRHDDEDVRAAKLAALIAQAMQEQHSQRTH